MEQKQRERIDAYSLLLATAYYDKNTVAPKKGNKERNRMLSFMSGEAFEIETDPKYIEAVEFLKNCDLGYEKNHY